MRILHFIHTPRFSGAEMLVLAIAKLHASNGHESIVVAMNPVELDFMPAIAEQRKCGINWIFPRKRLSRLGRLNFIRKAAIDFNADVIFAHSVLPAAYARLAGLANTITVLHDASENDYSAAMLSFVERFLQYRSLGVVAVSERAKINYSNKYLKPPIVRIANGIPLARYTRELNFSRQALLASLGLPLDSIVVLQVGRIAAIKQQHLSVRSVAPLIKRNKRIHLLFAGLYEDKSSLSMLNEEVSKFSVGDNVHILGPRDDVVNLLKIASVYLMPSKQEAHSVALIEALASGVPVVASNIHSFRYCVDMDGVHLINPNDVLEFEKTVQLEIDGNQRYFRDLSEFDIEATADKYISFARSCLDLRG